jgi:hypothetical protein
VIQSPPSWRDCTTSLFPCGLSPAGSAPAPLLSSLLSSLLLSSPLVALLSLLRMKYCGRPSSALLRSPSLLFASSAGGG